MNPLFKTDFYKVGHKFQYPRDTTLVYSNFTPRSDKLAHPLMQGHGVVVFGIQGFIQTYLIDDWDTNFFNRPKDEVVNEYEEEMKGCIGGIPVDHIADLHDLGFLPLIIKALPEGTVVPIRTPVLTVYNTNPKFFWLTNYIETLMSCELWQPMTSATIAHTYKKLLVKYAEETGVPLDFVNWQGHDFSYRGMAGHDAAMKSGAAHLLSFTGTDTIPAIRYLTKYYNATGLIGGSVPATEHSVMCSGGKESEIDTFKRLINDIYPAGIVSIVSDTWDYWKVLTEYAVELKSDILKREGKVVFRPDSGDPVKIICGDTEAQEGTPEYKGSIELLWDTFGGTINSKGYKELDSHVGLIYGDSITLERARNILEGLKEKGFASSNIVFGIGSFTYQYNTRDTFGFAMKATYVEFAGEGMPIFKDPKTDNGAKKSAKGLLKVNTDLTLTDEQEWSGEHQGKLRRVFNNGTVWNFQSLQEIRLTLAEQMVE
jgi:nicotinamide phosphoribosyltransferase